MENLDFTLQEFPWKDTEIICDLQYKIINNYNIDTLSVYKDNISKEYLVVMWCEYECEYPFNQRRMWFSVNENDLNKYLQSSITLLKLIELSTSEYYFCDLDIEYNCPTYKSYYSDIPLSYLSDKNIIYTGNIKNLK